MKSRKVTNRDRAKIGDRRHWRPFCSVMRKDGELCQRHAAYVITREDGSAYAVCTNHLNGMRRTWEAMPSTYPSVTVEAI